VRFAMLTMWALSLNEAKKYNEHRLYQHWQ